MAEVDVSAHVAFHNGIGRLARDLEAASTAAIAEGSAEGAQLSIAFAPKLTGLMASTIHPYLTGAEEGGWIVGTPYALDQEFGARPHVIGAGGEILANEHPAERFGPVRGPVDHPGNPATSYLRRAFAIVFPTIVDRIKRRMR